jgi:hypothetical protein
MSSPIRADVWEELTLRTACGLIICKIKEEINISVISGRPTIR